MIDRLPYTLTEGVTATREGLWITDTEPVRFMFPSWDDFYDGRLIYWDDAAERLKYREGEPYCESFVLNGRAGNLICAPPYEGVASAGIQLHRLAAILCDDATCFRVLHYCIMNHEHF